MSKRSAVLVVNPSRDEAITCAKELAILLAESNFDLVTISDVTIDGVRSLSASEIGDEELEIAIVLGGDGTILRAAEITLERDIPLLGVNLGRVGFMAEVEKPTMEAIAASVIHRTYLHEDRMVLGYSVVRDGAVLSEGWALNEITVERDSTTMVELFLEIDHRPLSHWGCDGLICSTPTGSTAYAFSAGGPIMWPEVDAFVLLPISAHALFARPMVIATSSEIVVTVESPKAVLSADALRKFALRGGDRVVITRNPHTIKLAHIKATRFTDRLVAKFKLPVEGWRGE